MDANMTSFYSLIGPADTRIKVSAVKTAKIQAIVEAVEGPEQMWGCINGLFNRYPEEGLINLALNRFFLGRPLSQDEPGGPRGFQHMSCWEKHLEYLVNNLIRLRMDDWTPVVRQLIEEHRPDMIDRFWGQSEEQPTGS